MNNGNWFHIYVGLIKNNKRLLSNLPMCWYNKGGDGWVYSGLYRSLYGRNKITDEKYGEYFHKKGDTLEMIFLSQKDNNNRQNNHIIYKINGNDYGVAFNKIRSGPKYRLIVILKFAKDVEIELIDC